MEMLQTCYFRKFLILIALWVQSVQFSHSVMSNSLRHHRLHAASQAFLSITNSWSLLKLMSIELVMPSNHLILCHPFSSCPHSVPASRSFPMSWLFPSGGQCPSTEYSGLISFRMAWLDLLAGQGTLKNLLQTTVQKHQFLVLSLLCGPSLTSIHDH